VIFVPEALVKVVVARVVTPETLSVEPIVANPEAEMLVVEAFVEKSDGKRPYVEAEMFVPEADCSDVWPAETVRPALVVSVPVAEMEVSDVPSLFLTWKRSVVCEEVAWTMKAIVSVVFLTWRKAWPVEVPIATLVIEVVAYIVEALKSQSESALPLPVEVEYLLPWES